MNDTPLDPNEEPTESEVIDLLRTYGDALEEHESTKAGLAHGAAQREGNAEMENDDHTVDDNVNDGHLNDGHLNDDHLVEVDITPTGQDTPGRGRVLVGALAVSALAVFGVLLATNQNNDSQVTAAEEVAVTSEPPATVVESDEANETGGDVAADTEGADAVDPIESEAADEDSAMTSIAVPDLIGHSTVAFVDGEYVSFSDDGNGIALARSSNGTDWSSELVEGLPDHSYPTMLVKTDSGLATVVEVYPPVDEDDIEFRFGGAVEPERFIAVSSNGTNWQTLELPTPDVADNKFTYLSAMAAAGDRLAVTLQIENGHDEMAVLIENGLLTEDQLEQICGSDAGEGQAIIFYSCDEVVDEGDEAIDFEQTELLRVEPGDAGYDELAESFFTGPDEFPSPPVVVSGSIDGDFSISEFPAAGYISSVVGTSNGFVAVANDFESGDTRTFSSPDGATWTEAGTIPDVAHIQGIAESGDRLIAAGSTFDPEGTGMVVYVSDDLGASWTKSTIDTALFGAYANVVAGPAGFAMQVEGSIEPYEDPFIEVGDLNIVKDGYTMVMDLESSITALLGPDGVAIHEDISPELAFDDGAENVVRTENFGQTIVWLDPVTGEDLVSIDESDFEAAYVETFGDDPFGDSDFVEPDRGTELWFSTDGVVWTLLESDDEASGEDGYSQLSAVGDDEVIIRTEIYVEPPETLFAFEQEGRDPTDDEIAALDAFFADQAGSAQWRAIPVG